MFEKCVGIICIFRHKNGQPPRHAPCGSFWNILSTIYVRRREPAIYSRELVDQIFIQPYCRIGNLVDVGIGHRETASKYLKVLRDIGVLEEMKVGREKLFVNPRFLCLLTTDTNEFERYPV